jgi:hypothetical protein
MANNRGVVVAALVVAFVALGLIGAQTAGNKKTLDSLQETTRGTSERGQKICSCFVPGNWRDSMVVPESWTKDLCLKFGLKTGATSIQLGCVFSNDVEFGAETELRTASAAPPARNCGW